MDDKLWYQLERLGMKTDHKSHHREPSRCGSYYRYTNSKNAVLAHSHYSDPAFDEPNGAVIFGSESKGLSWDYADRLDQWDREKSERCWKEAVEKHGTANTARRIETYLSLYHGKPVDLRCILSGTQPFNGYPWYAYGYTFTD